VADLIVLIHFSFILFVIFGGFLALKWRKFIWLHVPAAVWGTLIEFFGWLCPLTTLENELRRNNDGEAFSTGFIEHYIIPLIYPEGLTRDIQIVLGFVVIVFNLFIYTLIFKKWTGENGKSTE
ncbi:MAG: DUF2784 domain-containing protein, partial [Methylococcales bacterium]|nr:DUF2784 domain-containing protein [Methylococcales bacterium]